MEGLRLEQLWKDVRVLHSTKKRDTFHPSIAPQFTKIKLSQQLWIPVNPEDLQRRPNHHGKMAFTEAAPLKMSE